MLHQRILDVIADYMVSTVLCLLFGDLLWCQIAAEGQYWKRRRSLHVSSLPPIEPQIVLTYPVFSSRLL
jgi:hypothetical protein